MVIISKRAIKKFSEREPNAAEALINWYKKTKSSDWNNFSEMKKAFNSADSIGNGLYVFNIKGNHYPLITRTIFKVRTVFIKFIGTHQDYDKINLKDF